jgi:STE24 endopeptidase
MNTFTLIFLATIVAGLTLQLWLVSRQAAHIISHRTAVPKDFADSISLEQHQKAASYSLARLALERWDLALGAVVLVGWTLGGGLS